MNSDAILFRLAMGICFGLCLQEIANCCVTLVFKTVIYEK